MNDRNAAVVKGQGIASGPRSATAKGSMSRADAPWPSTTADEYDPIPWFTDQHAREAAERMKAWASGAGHVPQLAASVLSDAEWLNLARVALELRPR